MRFKKCRKCHQPDLTVADRGFNLGMLCASCHCDERAGSSVRKVAVPERQEQDRYAQMAVRYGIR